MTSGTTPVGDTGEEPRWVCEESHVRWHIYVVARPLACHVETFILYEVFGIQCVFYTHSALQFRLATCQVLSSPVGLVAITWASSVVSTLSSETPRN